MQIAGPVPFFQHMHVFHSDREMAFIAVQGAVHNIRIVAEALRDDEEIARAAVTGNLDLSEHFWDYENLPLALLSPRLRDNRELVLAALR